jgi:endogenous inhibitor of DNA gyrase (YacG/DUF329 family)
MLSRECKECGDKLNAKDVKCATCGTPVARLSIGTWVLILIVVPMFIYGYLDR